MTARGQPLNPITRSTIPSAEWTHSWIDRSNCKRVVPMKVLVLGWPRTGSKSTSAALYILGFDDVYHFSCAIANPPDCYMWRRAIDAKWNGKGTFTKDDWDALLGHCQAVTDFPAAAFADELLAAYPDAKVLLNIRPTDKWYESVKLTVFRAVDTIRWYLRPLYWTIVYFGHLTKVIHPMQKALRNGVTGGNLTSKNLRAAYEAHNAHIQAVVPPERLLLWGPHDGWEPLCKFLDVPIPQQPIPFFNDGKYWVNNTNGMLIKDLKTAVRRILLGSAGLVGLGWGIMRWRSEGFWPLSELIKF